MPQNSSFTHRLVTGWTSDYSSRPLWEPWPSIVLDKAMLADLLYAIGRTHEAGYTGMILWGLIAGRSWNPFLADTVNDARRRDILMIIEAVRSKGLDAYLGLGLNSWGFDAIIEANPEVDGGSPQNMCASRPQSWEWMRKVVDFVMSEYDPDGVSMQSSDQGRCGCDSCQEMGALEYHATINDQVAGYIRERWPDKKIGISTWGMDLGNPAEQDHVLKMTRHVDVLNDFNNSAARTSRENRKALIGALGCAYGTEQGFWFDPPPYWERDKWFLPFSLSNVSYWKDLKADGGDQIERYILPLANPGAEVGFLFDGWMLQDLTRDPTKALADALQFVFEPKDQAGLDGLIELWELSEDAFIAALPRRDQPRQISSSRIHYTHPTPSHYLATRPEYLQQRSPEVLTTYHNSLQQAASLAAKLRPVLSQARSRDLLRCIYNAQSDAAWALRQWA